jgi:hypothetical protein
MVGFRPSLIRPGIPASLPAVDPIKETFPVIVAVAVVVFTVIAEYLGRGKSKAEKA